MVQPQNLRAFQNVSFGGANPSPRPKQLRVGCELSSVVGDLHLTTGEGWASPGHQAMCVFT